MSTKKLTAFCIIVLTAIAALIAFKVYSNYEADRQATIKYQQEQLEESKKDKEYAKSQFSEALSRGDAAISSANADQAAADSKESEKESLDESSRQSESASQSASESAYESSLKAEESAQDASIFSNGN